MYRLVWFQHVHKAAGSTIVNQAVANGETLFPIHENGNPCTEDGELIPIWDFDEEGVGDFVDECETRGVSFVATEWGAPNYSALCDDPRVFLVTCIREPWSRLISNFNYDYYLGYADSSTLTGYFNEEHRIKMDNLLIRIFANKLGTNKDSLGQGELADALDNLLLFDLVIVTDRDGDMGMHLFEALGWEKKNVDSHSTFGNLWTLARLLRRLRLLSAIKYLLKMKLPVSEEERALFEVHSNLDMELYHRVCEDEIRGRGHPLERGSGE